MKRKERRMLSGIKKGALYLYRHSSIINISLDDIDDWLCEFYLASDFSIRIVSDVSVKKILSGSLNRLGIESTHEKPLLNIRKHICKVKELNPVQDTEE
mgnify:CR=1 FL=1